MSSENDSFFLGFYIDVYFYVSIKSPTLEVTILDLTQIQDIYGLSYNEYGTKTFYLTFSDFTYYTS